LETEENKIVDLNTLTESHTTQINFNDADILALQRRLKTEETKIVDLETLTASHTTDTGGIISKQDQRRGYHLWATSSCTSGTE
jgi:hypothetical protein